MLHGSMVMVGCVLWRLSKRHEFLLIFVAFHDLAWFASAFLVLGAFMSDFGDIRLLSEHESVFNGVVPVFHRIESIEREVLPRARKEDVCHQSPTRTPQRTRNADANHATCQSSLQLMLFEIRQNAILQQSDGIEVDWAQTFDILH